MIALLYNIRSLYNVGSIFRTADATGFKKIYLCGITPTPLDRFGNKKREMTKVALGAEDYLSWEKIGDSSSPQATISLIKKLKKEGFLICAVEQDKKSTLLNKFHNKNKEIALIIGDEVRGVSKSVLKHCDYILEIPMFGKKESLNVSVAFGIAAFKISQES